MRLTFWFLLLSVSFAFAEKSHSQNARVNLNSQQAIFKDVLKEIEQQTDYLFISNRDINLERKVSIRAKNKPVREVLNQLFASTDLSYAMEGVNIIITQRNAATETGNLQQAGKRITGTVTDEKGEAVIGANVIEKGTTNGNLTDVDGKFSIEVSPGATLIITFIGYIRQEIPVGNQTNLTITLVEDTKALEEVIVVGYGTQKKQNLTGAISAIKGSDVIVTKNENVQNMLTGKILGVRSIQRTAEPGEFYNQMDIRGMGSPLVIIDDIPRDMSAFQRLDPNDIENISVLKDATAAIYGVHAANGVMLVTTRQGSFNEVKPNVTYSGSYTWQMPSGFPELMNIFEHVELKNETTMHSMDNPYTMLDENFLAPYINGTQQGTDWYSLIIAKSAPQTMHNLNITGGTKRTKYYVGMGTQYQESFFKSGDLNYTKYNLRSNLSTKITDRLTFEINLNGIMDINMHPRYSSPTVIRDFWRMGPHIPAYADAEQTRLFHGLLEGRNAIPYIETDYSGYQKNNKKWFQSSAALNYDIPGIDGLSAKALVSYDYYNSDYTEFRKSWNQYRYDEASETYSIWTLDAPDRVNRQYHLNNQILAQVALNFDRAFDVHKVNARLIWEMQKRDGDNFYAQRDLILPMPYLFAGSTVSQIGSMNAGALYKTANNALAGRANYTYSDKYLLELLFRYDGSSRFGSGHQYGFFPAASVGWRISEESFFKNSKLSFIEQLKIRASYGVLGDDAGSSYQFLTGYTYPAPTDHPRFAVGGNVFDGNYVDGAVSMGIPNTQITWYTSNTLNIGFDFSAWNGLLGATVEYFDRHRKGLLARRIGDIPTVVGASIPVENLNSDKTFGLEIELSHRNKIGDVRYGLKGMFSVTRLKQLHVESNPYSSSWDNWKNNINDRLYNQASGEGNFGTYVNNASGGQNWTYGDAGHYTSWEDIWSSDIRLGRSTILGDYKSVDWNGDGVINSNDRYINRYGSRPLMNFSLIANTEYKGFDLQLLFQGSAMSKFTYIDGLSYPFWGGVEASGMKQFTDRWHPVDPLANPYDPATKWTSGYYAYTGSRPNQDAEVNMVNSDYLRLKSVELGYSFPIKNTLKKLRLYVNAYNLLTFSAMKWVDPEHPEDEVGCMYPLNKSVSVGLNLNF